MHAWAVAAAGMHGSTSDLLACSWFKRSLSLVPSLLRHAHHAFRAGINRAVTLRLLPLTLGSNEGTKGTATERARRSELGTHCTAGGRSCRRCSGARHLATIASDRAVACHCADDAMASEGRLARARTPPAVPRFLTGAVLRLIRCLLPNDQNQRRTVARTVNEMCIYSQLDRVLHLHRCLRSADV